MFAIFKKPIILVGLLLALSIISCKEDSVVQPPKFWYGLGDYGSNGREQNAILDAYEEAFANNKIKTHYGSSTFAEGTELSDILRACSEAETAIVTSSISLSTRYTYEIRKNNRNGELVYSRAYGLRLRQ